MPKRKKVTSDDIKTFIIRYLTESLEESGRTLEGDLPEDYDLLLEGVVDSLGMLTLTAEVEKHFDYEIDFEEIDPEEMTIVGPLCHFIETEINRASADQA
ncbi:MAG: acyl carrier protein [Planctomycetes bacterium]|nr:acyl carrier protein [Planctomycetota bacterium]